MKVRILTSKVREFKLAERDPEFAASCFSPVHTCGLAAQALPACGVRFSAREAEIDSKYRRSVKLQKVGWRQGTCATGEDGPWFSI